MYAEQQKQAMTQYLIDKKYHVSHESITFKRASFSGYINTQTGDVLSIQTVIWRYFGKQASRTVYHASTKVSETIYTW